MPPSAKTMLACEYPSCRAKYVRPEKLIAHVEKQHPLWAKNSNRVKLTPSHRRFLAGQLHSYIVLLEHKTDNGTARRLLPQESSPSPQELETIISKHEAFCAGAKSLGLDRIVTHSQEQLDRVCDEFAWFLNLGTMWTGDNFCPTMLIDFVWHAAMLDPDGYRRLCQDFLGRLLPHSLPHNEAPESQAPRYQQFVKQFRHWHGRMPLQPDDLIQSPPSAKYDVDTFFSAAAMRFAEQEAVLLAEQLEKDKQAKAAEEYSRRLSEAAAEARRKHYAEEQVKYNLCTELIRQGLSRDDAWLRVFGRPAPRERASSC